MIETEREKEEACTNKSSKKNVFNQKADSVLFSYSKMIDGKHTNLSVKELTVNVKNTCYE